MDWFSPEETTAIGLSLKVAVVAALASLPFGVAVAWLLARRRFPGKGLLDALVHLPLVLPPVVMGYALLVMFGNQGRPAAGCTTRSASAWLPLDRCGTGLRGDGVPADGARNPAVDRERGPALEQAAATLGAAPWRVFLTVTLPLAWPGLVAGGALAFAKAPGRIRRDHHLRFRHPRRDADAVGGHLRTDAGARRRSGHLAPGGGVAADLARRAAAVGMAGAAPPPRGRRGMSMSRTGPEGARVRRC
ncbi:ABC transporter permease subunit [Pseudoxanthomonas sp. NC8]|nr:ABC transporter permease subunit [Pseudoxanthomonas sp. NC8]